MERTKIEGTHGHSIKQWRSIFFKTNQKDNKHMSNELLDRMSQVLNDSFTSSMSGEITEKGNNK